MVDGDGINVEPGAVEIDGNEQTRGIYARVQRWLGIRNVASAIGSLALVFGAIYGWMEYNRIIEERIVDRSFEYSDSYSRGEVFEARRALREVIEETYVEFEKASVANRNAGIDQLLIETINRFPNFLYLETFVEYFDSVNKCIEVGGCDPRTLHYLLREKSADLSWFLTPVISNQVLEKGPKYARGLRNFQNGKLSEQCTEGGAEEENK